MSNIELFKGLSFAYYKAQLTNFLLTQTGEIKKEQMPEVERLATELADYLLMYAYPSIDQEKLENNQTKYPYQAGK